MTPGKKHKGLLLKTVRQAKVPLREKRRKGGKKGGKLCLTEVILKN